MYYNVRSELGFQNPHSDPIGGSLLVSSVHRAINILELLSQKGPLTLEDVSKFTLIPRTSVFKLLKTLEKKGYVQRSQSKYGSYLWNLGLSILTLAGSRINQLDIRFEVRDILEDLAEVTNEFVQLAVLYEDEILFLDVIKRQKPLATYAGVGSRLPINVCAAGLVLATYCGERHLKRILRKKLPKNTPKTVTSPSELRKLLKEVVKKGFSIDDEYYAIGHRCIGAPIFDYSGKVVAAINISGSISSITGEKIPMLIKQVVNHAAKASEKLGYSRGSRDKENH